MVGGQWLVVGEREMAVVLGGARRWHRQRQARVGVDRGGSEGEDGEGGVRSSRGRGFEYGARAAGWSMAAVSVVIRALNEAAHLPVLLDGLACQSRRADEIVLVDSGSSDGTVAIAEEASARIVAIEPSRFHLRTGAQRRLRRRLGGAVRIRQRPRLPRRRALARAPDGAAGGR